MNTYLNELENSKLFDLSNNPVEVEGVSLDKESKTFTIDVIFDKALTLDEYYGFIKFNNDLFQNIGYSYKLCIIYKENTLTNEESKKYIEQAIKELAETDLSVRAFLNFDIKIDGNNVVILVDNTTPFYDAIAENIRVKLSKDFFLNYNISLEESAEARRALQDYLREQDEKDAIKLAEAKEEAKEKAKMAEIKITNKEDKDFRQRASIHIDIKDIPYTQDELSEYQNTKGMPFVEIEGEIFQATLEEKGKNKSLLLSLKVTDGTDTIGIKKWIKAKAEEELAKKLKPGEIVKIRGKIEYDTYAHTILISADKIEWIGSKEKKEVKDTAEVKRVELHTHTKASNLDGLSTAKEYIKLAKKWGHTAMGFCDRNGVYEIPDVLHALDKGDTFKPLYGVELDYIDDINMHITYDPADIDLKDATYVVFDLETTGFSQTNDEIIEIGAHKVKDGVIIDEYETFVNPGRSLPDKITELTSITWDNVKDAPSQEEAIGKFLEFTRGCIVVAHNADFDIGMMRAKAMKYGYGEQKFVGIDTLNLLRTMYYKDLKKFNLKAMCKFFKVKQEHHHRATDDTRVTAQCFIQLLEALLNKGITNYKDINSLMKEAPMHELIIPSRICVIAKNQVGYKNMYKLLSDSLTVHLGSDARCLRSVLDTYREGLIVMSAGSFGDVFEAALNGSDKELDDAISYCDVIEVNPIGSYKHLIEFLNDGNDGTELIRQAVEKIIDHAKKLDKMVVATSDCYYISPDQKKYRDILIASNQVGGGIHELARYSVAPDAHIRSTDEMLTEFEYLPKELAYEIVVTNTNLVADSVEPIQCFHKKLFVPADDEFKDHPDPKYRFPSMIGEMNRVVAANMLERYGENPHPYVKARIDRELHSIITSGYYSTYFMAYLMVKDSLDNGYLVGSRGSVGSSLAATMMNITEVNPLPPHYVCPHCKFMAIKFSEEQEDNIASQEESDLESVLREAGSGFDLPDMPCPKCGTLMAKDGHDIPFETFLGFKGDKVPDIDLNFSGEYQPQAHLFVRHLMGYDNSFRGGTVATIQDKNAFGYVKAYQEKIKKELRNPEMERIAANLIDIKRSTGQHPGGIVVVPKEIDIYDVTPIQYAANDSSNAWRTTHFDYHAFEDNLLKLDILGHDDPTLIKYFMDIVHAHQDEFPFSDARKIPLDDKNVFELFGSTKSIGVKPSDIDSEVASFAVPEFGTNFVRKMLIDTKPTSLAGLVKISGLSHGTNVWLNNAAELVAGTTPHGKIEFSKIIGCRDDIMVDLMAFGMEPGKAFKIMEFVRKNKKVKSPDEWIEFKKEMKEGNVPEWYIWSCEQIEYMFPKAHATAYVIMALRIAWFKVYKPAMFYAAYFSKRAKAYNLECFLGTTNKIREKLEEWRAEKDRTAKIDDLITCAEVVLEAKARGMRFAPVDIFKSDAVNFQVEGPLDNGTIRLPFTAVDGLGEAAALDIVAKREEKAFTSCTDVLKRTKLNQSQYDLFIEQGFFGDLPEEEPESEIGLFAL